MEFTKNMYFVGKRQFKSKEGKQFNVVSFADQDEKSGTGSVSEMFIDTMPALCSSLNFLDKVSCTLDLVDMGSKPRLLSIDKLLKAFTEGK